MWPEYFGNLWRLSGGDPGGAHHPDPWMILALPVGEETPEGLCDVFGRPQPTPHPDVMWGSLTWDHGCERCTCHAALTLVTDMKMCFRLVLVLHGNGEPIENTGGLNL